MDERKDIRKDDPISRFFDDYHVRTNPFGENRSGERLYRRCERIAAGLHLVTNHIASDEPLRRSVRSSAIAVLDDTLRARDEFRTDSITLAQLRARLRMLISDVRLLTVAGFVSLPNATVLIEAIDEANAYIGNSQRSPLADRIVLSRESLNDSGNVREVLKSVKDIKDREVIKDNGGLKDSLGTSVKMSDGVLSPRKGAILDVLQPGLELGIRDIAAHLPEYGEKTVQRELSQLILLGRVKKVGFKRWSKYSRAA